VQQELIPYARTPFPLVYFTTEEQEVVRSKKPDIDAYFQQMEAKFITGAESIDGKWDEYVRTLESLGIEEYVAAYQSAYDRWAASR
jgi:putative aldouronate transport system substrate-binding protein